MKKHLEKRPRRLRRSEKMRGLLTDTTLQLSHLIQPYFLTAQWKNTQAKETISGFSGVYRWGKESLTKQIELDLERGLRNFLLFGATQNKDERGSGAIDPNESVSETLQTLRKQFGSDVVLFTDVCLCPFTSHGHCGIIKGDEVDNDTSVEQLSKMAVLHAQSGADIVAPSDMMDGRIGAIRDALDQQGYTQIAILAYTAKYRSSYYGPFREALDSAPQKGDRSSYQMDWRRDKREALRELLLDTEEGADMVMVKPALPYLDIIAEFREHSEVPVAAYCVSAEYEMVKQMAKIGMVDEKSMFLENLTAIRRAGAQVIVTYAASQLAEQQWVTNRGGL